MILPIPHALGSFTALAHVQVSSNNTTHRTTSQKDLSKVGTQSIALLRLFFALQIICQISLSILVVTFIFSKSIKRHPTVVNVCIIWVLSGVISCLLFYTGHAFGSEPFWMLCAIQASLLDGVLPMGATSILALTVQLYFNVTKSKVKDKPVRTAFLIIAPYFTFAMFVLGGTISADTSPSNVSRDRRFFYCPIHCSISVAFTIFTAVVLLATIGLTISIICFLHRNWQEVRRAAATDLQLLLRVGLFVAYVVISFVVTILTLSHPQTPFPDLFAATIGPSYALVLASQPDVYRTWIGLITRRHKFESEMPSTGGELFSEFSEIQNRLESQEVQGAQTLTQIQIRHSIIEIPPPPIRNIDVKPYN